MVERRTWRAWCWPVAVVLMAGMVLGGCGTRRLTDPARTASEQLLIAAAVDRAAAQLDFTPLTEYRVYISADLVDRLDKSFLVASVRMHAWYAGCIVVDEIDQAEVVVELRSGAVGIDRSEYLLGIPQMALPTRFGEVPIPEAAVYKTVRQIGASRLSFLAYRVEDRQFLYTSGPFYGFSNQRTWWVMGAGPAITDNILPRRDRNGVMIEPPPQPAPLPPEDTRSP